VGEISPSIGTREDWLVIALEQVGNASRTSCVDKESLLSENPVTALSARQSDYDWDLGPLEPLPSAPNGRWDYDSDLGPCGPTFLGIDYLDFERQIFDGEIAQSEEI
jgi:hypothetical protein